MDMKSEKTRLGYEWKFYNNGSASSNGSGAGLMLIDPEGKEYTYALRFEFEITNNEAEYEALLAGLSIKEKEILQVKTKEEESWMAPIHEYLVSGLLLEDPKETRKIRVKALLLHAMASLCSSATN
ncbi:reverse transcriptase domain-containing protein [Tanacetum coccineum]